MNLAYTITIGTCVGTEPMPQDRIDHLLRDVQLVLEHLSEAQYSRPRCGVELSQVGSWKDEATGEIVHETNLIWTGEVKETLVFALKRFLTKVARDYQQDAIALVIAAPAMLIKPAK